MESIKKRMSILQANKHFEKFINENSEPPYIFKNKGIFFPLDCEIVNNPMNKAYLLISGRMLDIKLDENNKPIIPSSSQKIRAHKHVIVCHDIFPYYENEFVTIEDRDDYAIKFYKKHGQNYTLSNLPKYDFYEGYSGIGFNQKRYYFRKQFYKINARSKFLRKNTDTTNRDYEEKFKNAYTQENELTFINRNGIETPINTVSNDSRYMDVIFRDHDIMPSKWMVLTNLSEPSDSVPSGRVNYIPMRESDEPIFNLHKYIQNVDPKNIEQLDNNTRYLEYINKMKFLTKQDIKIPFSYSSIYDIKNLDQSIIDNNAIFRNNHAVSLYFDIETYDTNPNLVPLPELETSTMFMLNCIVTTPLAKISKNVVDPSDSNYDWELPVGYNAAICLTTCMPSKPLLNRTIIVCKDEKEIIEYFARLLNLYKPDFISGFNTHNYDWMWVHQRAIKHKIYTTFIDNIVLYVRTSIEHQNQYDFSKNYHKTDAPWKKTYIKVLDTGKTDVEFIKVFGVVVYDLRFQLRKNGNGGRGFSKNSLKFFCKFYELCDIKAPGGGKVDVDPSDIHNFYEYHKKVITFKTQLSNNKKLNLSQSDVDRDTLQIMRLIEYCFVDVIRCSDIAIKANMPNDFYELSNISLLDLSTSIVGAGGAKVRSVNYYEGKKRNYRYNTNRRVKNVNEDDKYPGAYVIPPNVGLKTARLNIDEYVDIIIKRKENIIETKFRNDLRNNQYPLDIISNPNKSSLQNDDSDDSDDESVIPVISENDIQRYLKIYYDEDSSITNSKFDYIHYRDFVISYINKFRSIIYTESRNSEFWIENSHILKQKSDTLDKPLLPKFPNIIMDWFNVNHDYPSAALDFSSLYPSIMRAFNLSPDTMNPEDNNEHINFAANDIRPDELYRIQFTMANNPSVEIKGFSIRHRYNEECEKITNPDEKRKALMDMRFGIMPTKLNELFNERALIKKRLKPYNAKIESYDAGKILLNEDELSECIYQINYLNSKQAAIKIIMNTFYGETGNPLSPLYIPALAGGVTTIGREYLVSVKKYIEDVHKCDVKYGDTDSLYFSIDESLFEEINILYFTVQITRIEFMKRAVEITFEHLNSIIQTSVNKMLVNKSGGKFMAMAYEEVGYPSFFFSKKKYVMVPHVNIFNTSVITDPEDFKLFIRGMELVKENTTELIKKYSYGILRKILTYGYNGNDEEIVLDTIMKFIRDSDNRDIIPIKYFYKSASYKPDKNNQSIKQMIERLLMAKQLKVNMDDAVKKYTDNNDTTPIDIGDDDIFDLESKNDNKEVDDNYIPEDYKKFNYVIIETDCIRDGRRTIKPKVSDMIFPIDEDNLNQKVGKINIAYYLDTLVQQLARIIAYKFLPKHDAFEYVSDEQLRKEDVKSVDAAKKYLLKKVEDEKILKKKQLSEYDLMHKKYFAKAGKYIDYKLNSKLMTISTFKKYDIAEIGKMLDSIYKKLSKNSEFQEYLNLIIYSFDSNNKYFNINDYPCLVTIKTHNKKTLLTISKEITIQLRLHCLNHIQKLRELNIWFKKEIDNYLDAALTNAPSYKININNEMEKNLNEFTILINTLTNGVKSKYLVDQIHDKLN